MAMAINNCEGADTSPPPTTSNQKRYPELVEGVRIQYISRDGATRAEVIDRRDCDIIFVRSALGKRSRVKLVQVIGYWPDKVVSSPGNLRKLEDKKEFIQKLLVI